MSVFLFFDVLFKAKARLCSPLQATLRVGSQTRTAQLAKSFTLIKLLTWLSFDVVSLVRPFASVYACNRVWLVRCQLFVPIYNRQCEYLVVIITCSVRDL